MQMFICLYKSGFNVTRMKIVNLFLMCSRGNGRSWSWIKQLHSLISKRSSRTLDDITRYISNQAQMIERIENFASPSVFSTHVNRANQLDHSSRKLHNKTTWTKNVQSNYVVKSLLCVHDLMSSFVETTGWWPAINPHFIPGKLFSRFYLFNGGKLQPELDQ